MTRGHFCVTYTTTNILRGGNPDHIGLYTNQLRLKANRHYSGGRGGMVQESNLHAGTPHNYDTV